MPKVSVNTCTYNRAHLIGQTIKSVLNQSFQDFEYIIVDDGSTDNTEEVVNSFKDNRIQFFAHPRTQGQLSKLRNFGHSKSVGEYIAYIDSDDLWEKDKLENQIMALESNSQIGFSYTDIKIFRENTILKESIYHKTGVFSGSVFSEMLKNKIVICHTTLVIRRSSLEIIGPMDESFHSGDHDVVFHLSRLFNAHVIYRPLVLVRKHNQNSTGSHSLSLRLLNEHHRTLQKLMDGKLITKIEFRKAIACTSYDFARQLISSKDYRSIKKYLIKCLLIQPWHWKALAYWIITSSKQVLRY
jgi:cellulose synthase/poly-beta-1,6-N-acetylglucosamine synthase-like glycosyltransferase